ncbi:MAG: alpha-amylase family protein [Actinomyces sp.]|uniref:alpha-amylase family protein n=1 Tax=Actinomyces sp. TaxID=29317 RepID=UPI0026DC1DFF|nr:alpha-amylase family protein [Actinomyces sp.]MDO4243670.1 alpha-amylase family protein [Actinomyces sp.]
MSAWIRHCVWWHVYPLGFAGVRIRPEADGGGGTENHGASAGLDSLGPWLDYLIGLGANGLALGPVFRSQTHGYDTVDYYAIDPRLGDDAAFDRLISGCHDRGIAVMLDGVFNHVGTGHPLFRAAMEGDEAAGSMFHLSGEGVARDYRDFEGHRGLAALNHDSPRVAELVADVMRHWLRRGASAWRLDAAYAVAPEFWNRVLPQVRREFPEAWFVGEVIHGDYADLVQRSGIDSVTQYELWKAIWSSLADGNFYELDWCLKRHNELLETMVPMTFVGNHDVTRIASRIGEEATRLAVAVLLTVGGIPSVYYGDERGLRGVKRDELGGDDEVRPAFPAGPEYLDPSGEPMMRLHQELLALRRRQPWLTAARTETRHLDNRAYEYEAVGADGQGLVVDLRLDPHPSATISPPDEPVIRIG